MSKSNKNYVYFIVVLLLFGSICIGTIIFNTVRYYFVNSDDIVAEIGDEKILKKDVENRILAIKINNEASKQAAYKNYDEDTANSMIKQIKDCPTFKNELNNMIESAKIRKHLKQINKEVTYNEAVEFTDKYILNASTSETRRFALEMLEKEGMTEEKYKSSIYSYYYDLLCNTRLFEYFNENLYVATSKTSLQDQYKEYLKQIF